MPPGHPHHRPPHEAIEEIEERIEYLEGLFSELAKHVDFKIDPQSLKFGKQKRSKHHKPPHEQIEELEERLDYFERLMQALIKHNKFTPPENLL